MAPMSLVLGPSGAPGTGPCSGMSVFIRTRLYFRDGMHTELSGSRRSHSWEGRPGVSCHLLLLNWGHTGSPLAQGQPTGVTQSKPPGLGTPWDAETRGRELV